MKEVIDIPMQIRLQKICIPDSVILSYVSASCALALALLHMRQPRDRLKREIHLPIPHQVSVRATHKLAENLQKPNRKSNPK